MATIKHLREWLEAQPNQNIPVQVLIVVDDSGHDEEQPMFVDLHLGKNCQVVRTGFSNTLRIGTIIF